MKTLVGTPEQPRHRNNVSWTTAGKGGNCINDGTGGGNRLIDWLQVNTQR